MQTPIKTDIHEKSKDYRCKKKGEKKQFHLLSILLFKPFLGTNGYKWRERSTVYPLITVNVK